jgi:2-oxoglutarate ferredoxin oxidoreductase subunit beta
MQPTDPFHNDVPIQWCPGCPNHLILKAVKGALGELGLAPEEVCLVSGIGQAAKLPHYLRCNFFNGLHGRALPAAQGILAANPRLTVLVTTGEGDCYGEGGNHFLHALRRNPDLTLLVHDNTFYALTKGQASPTTPAGEVRSLHPQGVETPPLNPLGIAILQGCGFVARGFALEPDHLRTLLVEAVRYRGLSVIDVVQPCITWERRPVSWFRERIYKLGEEHDPADRQAALRLTEEGEKCAVGVLYRGPPRPTFGAHFREKVSDRPLAELGVVDREAVLEAMREGTGV